MARLASCRIGVLGTVDPIRGAHLVPVVFAIDGDRLAIPIDTIKSKASLRLRRTSNLEADPRASLLVDGRSDDWEALWWVRADLTFVGEDDPAMWRDVLADRYPAYATDAAVHTVLAFSIDGLAGWSATDR